MCVASRAVTRWSRTNAHGFVLLIGVCAWAQSRGEGTPVSQIATIAGDQLGAGANSRGQGEPAPPEVFADWQLLAMECQGKSFPVGDVWILSDPVPVHPLLRFSISKNLRVFYATGSGKVREVCSISLDSRGPITALDLTSKKGTLAGIIRIDGGTLVVCIGVNGKSARPDGFSTRHGDDRLVLLYSKKTTSQTPVGSGEQGSSARADIRRPPLSDRADRPITLESLVNQPNPRPLQDITKEELSALPQASVRELARVYSSQRAMLEEASKRCESYSKEFGRRHLSLSDFRETVDAFDRWLDEPDACFQGIADRVGAISRKWNDMSVSRKTEAERLSRILERIREKADRIEGDPKP